MWRQTIKIFLMTLIAVLVVGSSAIYLFRHRSQPEIHQIMAPPPTVPVRSTSNSITNDKVLSENTAGSTQENHAGRIDSYLEVRDRFIREGWTETATDRFLKITAGWFAVMRRENPLAYTKQLTLLAALGSNQRLMPFLAEHPESAALFAVVENPTRLLRLFESAGEDYDFFVNLYVLHAVPFDAEQLTNALPNNGDLITRLYQQGLVGSEVIFFFNRTDESSLEYEQWLREILSVKLDKSEAELASLLNMALKYGPDIRLRLRRDESFRLAFRAKIWPKLARVAAANHDLFDFYLNDPRIWDLLALPEGEELLRLRGLLPIDLLFGYQELGREPYPADVHDTVIQALLQGDELTVKALLKFRNEPLFNDLLKRPVPFSVKTAAFEKLFEAEEKYRYLLHRYSTMSDKGLQDEVGPPPNLLKTWTPFYYTLWEVPKKLIHGRDPTSTDWFNSLADPASFLYPILKVGVALVNVRKTVLDIDQDSFSPDLKKTSIEMAEQQLGADLAAKLSDRDLIPFGVTGMLTRIQKAYREKVSSGTIVDCTAAVLFMLGYSGTSHSSLETLDAIDGHILLRGDSRLLIQPGNEFPSAAVSKYLTTSAHGFATASLPPVGRKPESSGIEPTPSGDHEDLMAWRQNVSGWWLMQASGMLYRPEPGRR